LRAIPGRGIWAGLALTPILIALVALIAASIGGGAASAGARSNTARVNPTTRARPMHINTTAPGSAIKYWTKARIAKATDLVTGQHIAAKVLAPRGAPGSPNTTFNWYPNFRRQPIYRNVLLLFRQNGNAHTCSGSVVSYDNPVGPPIEGPRNVVWTAGRCLHDGQGTEAGWSTDLLACPAHSNGGPSADNCWDWTSTSTTPEWYGDNWESRDYGVLFTNICRANGNCTSDIATVTQAYNASFSLPRAQHWWIQAYHHGTIGLPPPPATCGAEVPLYGYSSSCGGPRMTQTQFAYTHAALPANPAAGAPDTGPLVNSVGGNAQHAGVDSTRFTASPCPGMPAGYTGNPCTGYGTGAGWILNWQTNETRFGKSTINSNTTYADDTEDNIPGGQLQGTYFDSVTCFDYQAWVPNYPGPC
jgi:hypothetical protein